MNVNTQTTALPLATVVNQPTDSLRRENSQREVITQPVPTQQSSAEKGVASDRERGKSPTQNDEQINFAAIQEKAEKESTTISDTNSQEDNGRDTEKQQDKNDVQVKNNEADEHDNPLEAFEHQQEIRQLQNRDKEVRSHERAHDTAGGAYTGSPSYTFDIGPDGKKYAVAGSVSVDLSPIEGNPTATIAKMQKVRAAALAPANPSIQDTKVAASAQAIISQAQAQLIDEKINQRLQQGDEELPNVEGIQYTGQTDTFKIDEGISTERDSLRQSAEFDRAIESTLAAQERVIQTRDDKFIQRANVIESLYSTINKAYERPSRSQFEITA